MGRKMNRKQRKQKLKQRQSHGKPLKPAKLGRVVTVRPDANALGGTHKAVVLGQVDHMYILGNMGWRGHDSSYTLSNAPGIKLFSGASKFLDGNHTWLFNRNEFKV